MSEFQALGGRGDRQAEDLTGVVTGGLLHHLQSLLRSNGNCAASRRDEKQESETETLNLQELPSGMTQGIMFVCCHHETSSNQLLFAVTQTFI